MRAPEGMSQATGQAARRRRPGRPVLTGLALAAGTGLAVLAGPGTGSAAVAAGPATAAGTRYVQAWGSNINGQLGNGSSVNAGLPVKVHLPAGTRVTQLRAGCEFTLALTSAGQVLAWGGNNEGELGNGSDTATSLPVKVRLPVGARITAIRAGCRHGLALTATGQVLAWGSDTNGQLGNGTSTDSNTPVRVRLPHGTRVTAISAGESFSLAHTASGEVLAWGSNFEGELGNGSTADSDTPVRVRLPGTSKVTSLAAGAFFAVAGTSAGRVYSWGANNLGQLGNGSSAESSDVPVRVAISQSPAGPVRSLFAGCGHVLALFSPRLLMAWGANKYGELGIGSITPFSNVPVKVHLPAGRKIKAVGASCTDSLALTAGGDVLAWGDNSMDQLGDDGGPDPAVAPVDVDLPLGWRASSLGAGPDARSGFALVYKVKA